MKTVVFPRYPGVLSALGLLATPLRQDYVRTCRQLGPDFDTTVLSEVLHQLEAAANAWLDQENMAPSDRQILRYLDVRYPNQGHELQMLLPGGDGVTAQAMRQIEHDFHDQHERLYGFAIRTSTIQVVSVRIAAVGAAPRIELARQPAASSTSIRPSSERRIYIDDAEGYRICPAYARDAIPMGATIEGPAVVDQPDSTIYLRPGWCARADECGNLIASRAGDSA